MTSTIDTTASGTEAEPVVVSGKPPGKRSGKLDARAILKSYGSLIGIIVFAVVMLLVLPGSLTEFRLNNIAKYCAWAMVAVGIGLAWGRGGMLVMGQGVFFALGGYSMGMHLTLEATGSSGVPTFMILYDPLAPLPAWWEPFRSGAFTIFAIVAGPVIVASILGFAIFKRRVKGAYFAILTQALAVAFATLITSTIKYTGGDTGLSGFKTFFGMDISESDTKRTIYLLTAGLLVACLVVVWQLYRSRFGELLVATRDAEERVRFLGYDPANIKLVAFVVAAVMASVGGAMFVAIVGIISPNDVNASASIFMIAGVALGGRASLLGPALGAIAVGYGQSTLSERWPDQWIYLFGLLFVLVPWLLPGGVASIPSKVSGLVRRERKPAEPAEVLVVETAG